ncbi:hypothetical protein JCM6882_005916 [Rhodosporidiobolus microsporus]
MRFSHALGLAAGLRGLLLAWGSYQDARGPVPYTDVDYFVFSDAAACVVRPDAANCYPAKGLWASAALGDPYARATYRYTPLLALLLTPNALLHPAFGKVLFVVCDLLVGALLYRLCRRVGAEKQRATNAVAALWLLNPIVANISTRGSSEAVIGALVVSTLSLAERGSWDAAAILYGLAVHFKIFPVVYGSSLLSAMARGGDLRGSLVRMARFGVLSLATFAGHNAVLFLLWGRPFLHHTFLYHLGRLDHRHNFAPYFYPFYLAGSPASISVTLVQRLARHPFVAFVPQLGLSLVLGAFGGRQGLPFAWLAQTIAFVAFNKVSTSQYFLWFLWLLPPSLARLRLSRRSAIVLGGAWVGGQAVWLSQAYQLEIAGRARFVEVWAGSLLFLAVQSWLLRRLVSAFH